MTQPRISPFKGLRFNTQKLSLKDIVLPSYDFLAEREQKKYYVQSRENIIKFVQNRIAQPDPQRPYRGALRVLSQLLEKNEVLQSSESVFFLVEQSFEHPNTGQKMKRNSLLATASLERDRKENYLLRHEKTFEDPIATRVELLGDCPWQFDPVMTFYDDPIEAFESEISNLQSQTPLLEVEASSIHNRVWSIESPVTISKISEHFESRHIYIADGHHRLESAKRAGLKKVFVSLVNTHDPGWMILATHRLVRPFPFASDLELAERLKQKFEIQEMNRQKRPLEQLRNEEHAFLIYTHLSAFRLAAHKPFEGTDVECLRQWILEDIFGLSGREFEDQVAYTESITQSLECLKTQEYSCAIYLNPPHVDQIIQVARANGTLPQKSTYFYPKPQAGLIFYDSLD